MTGKTSAEHKVLQFLKENHDWFASGDLQRKEWANRDGTLSSPKIIARRLQENVYTKDNPEGILEVQYRDKNHAWYRVKQEHRKLKQVVTHRPDGSVKIEYVPNITKEQDTLL